MMARLTRHAFDRVHERLSLLPSEVEELLNTHKALDVGCFKGHQHRLFYSLPDAQCFVAVQDEQDGEVVTVLPLDYHASCAWVVPHVLQEEARARVLGEPLPKSKDPERKSRFLPSRFRVSAMLEGTPSKKNRCTVMRFDSEPYGCSITCLLAAPGMVASMWKAAYAILGEDAKINRLLVQLGRDGDEQEVPRPVV